MDNQPKKEKWTVTFQIFRQKAGGEPHWDDFKLEVDPDEYVLDGIERIWSFHDRSLVFRHACHHSTCGACGMRVNNVEKLTCITPMRDVTHDGGTVRVEPMRNFPVVSDLVVDMDRFYTDMERVGQRQVLPVSEAGVENSVRQRQADGDGEYMRLSDCIECGLCISACPAAATSPSYVGPAILAGAQQNGLKRNPELLQIVDSGDGLWRCHSAYECTAVCPSHVDPARRIMDLRRQVTAARFRRLFGRQ